MARPVAWNRKFPADFAANPRCCRSSVVEHSLGKGEVEISIISGSTISPHIIHTYQLNHSLFPKRENENKICFPRANLGKIWGMKADKENRKFNPVTAFGFSKKDNADEI